MPQAQRSILMPPAPRFNADWLVSRPQAEQTAFLEGLDANTLAALPWLFDFWALPHQLPPEGDWKSWVILGGRGAGKTRAGAEWVRAMVEGAGPLDAGQARRVALVGETIDQAREVMVMGESGILACAPPDRRPKWIATANKLVWPNGAEATLYSAHNAQALRGPQFDAAWLDELAKWKNAQECWDMLQFGLRLGRNPRQVITTTPRNTPLLRAILDRPTSVHTHAPTEANRAWLADSFLSEVRDLYGGGWLGRQELDGELIDAPEGAFWQPADLDAARLQDAPALDRVVVAVDPPVTGGSNADACGIVVAGAITQGPPHTWRAVVLEDASVQGASPNQWAEAAIAAMHRHSADRMVAEVNQGGDLVENLIRQIDPMVSYRKVHASRGKAARAEPVAALYEQGRVAHLRDMPALEQQMAQMTARGYLGQGSPDRLDALVWALFDLMIDPAARARNPRIRSLR